MGAEYIDVAASVAEGLVEDGRLSLSTLLSIGVLFGSRQTLLVLQPLEVIVEAFDFVRELTKGDITCSYERTGRILCILGAALSLLPRASDRVLRLASGLEVLGYLLQLVSAKRTSNHFLALRSVSSAIGSGADLLP